MLVLIILLEHKKQITEQDGICLIFKVEYTDSGKTLGDLENQRKTRRNYETEDGLGCLSRHGKYTELLCRRKMKSPHYISDRFEWQASGVDARLLQQNGEKSVGRLKNLFRLSHTKMLIDIAYSVHLLTY